MKFNCGSFTVSVHPAIRIMGYTMLAVVHRRFAISFSPNYNEPGSLQYV